MTSYDPRARPSGAVGTVPTLDLELMDGDRRYGWISGNRVGFVGFGDHVEAVGAAWVAHRTLMRRIAGATGTKMSNERRTFSLARYGGDEVILANEEPIAVLIRPTDGSTGDAGSFGFEIRIPGDVDEIAVRGTAYRIYRALKSSGIAWTLRRADGAAADADIREAPTNVTDQPVADAGDPTITVTGGRNDVIDQPRYDARRFLPPEWGRRRRARTRERAERRVRGLRHD